MTNTFTPVLVSNWKERVVGGYKLHSGWALKDAQGELVSLNRGIPWMPCGGKAAVSLVAASGLLDYTPVAAQS
jgi:hypothetical protein